MQTGLARLESVRDMIREYYERRLLMLDSDYEATKRDLQEEYERLMPKGVKEAGIPHIEVRSGPIALARSSDGLTVRLARTAYRWYFGEFPRVTHRNPLWAPLRHILRIVDAVAEAGGTDFFVISSHVSPIERLGDRFTGKHARFGPSVALSENFPLAFEQRANFHLCLCILEHADLREFPRIVKAVAPCMRPGGKIVGFHLNRSLEPLPANDSASSPPCRGSSTRSVSTMRVPPSRERCCMRSNARAAAVEASSRELHASPSPSCSHAADAGHQPGRGRYARGYFGATCALHQRHAGGHHRRAASTGAAPARDRAGAGAGIRLRHARPLLDCRWLA